MTAFDEGLAKRYDGLSAVLRLIDSEDEVEIEDAFRVLTRLSFHNQFACEALIDGGELAP